MREICIPEPSLQAVPVTDFLSWLEEKKISFCSTFETVPWAT